MATRDSRGGGVSSTEERRTRMNVRNGDRAIVYDLERNRADIQKEKEAAKSTTSLSLSRHDHKLTRYRFEDMDATSSGKEQSHSLHGRQLPVNHFRT